MMRLYEDLLEGRESLALVGLGYVGMPIAVAFSKKVKVTGFDLNSAKIEKYRAGYDPTSEVGDEEIKKCTVDFTDDEEKLKNAGFIIVAVPTPINQDKTPDLSPVEGASHIVGRNLKKGAVVVYESTVYPGVTEEVCIPILEQESSLKCGIDFKVGYSPERINPGDKIHRLNNIKKIVSGCDGEALDMIAAVYELVIDAGVHKASSIKVAEAAKVVENSQRDINIAFINELAMAFDRMGIDTNEVIDAMNTKWNALGFRPGLVGGHCIGVDPYYFVYEAEKKGYHSQIISSGRRVNDDMPQFVAEKIIKELVLSGKAVRDARVIFLGITFKENTPDVRNSKITEVAAALKEYGLKPCFTDPYADKEEVKAIYGYDLIELDDVKDQDCVVIGVAHEPYRKLGIKGIDRLFDNKLGMSERVIIDIKGLLPGDEVNAAGYEYWRL